MTVKELIEELQQCPPDYKVYRFNHDDWEWSELRSIHGATEKYLDFRDTIREQKGESARGKKVKGVFL